MTNTKRILGLSFGVREMEQILSKGWIIIDGKIVDLQGMNGWKGWSKGLAVS